MADKQNSNKKLLKVSNILKDETLEEYTNVNKPDEVIELGISCIHNENGENNNNKNNKKNGNLNGNKTTIKDINSSLIEDEINEDSKLIHNKKSEFTKENHTSNKDNLENSNFQEDQNIDDKINTEVDEEGIDGKTDSMMIENESKPNPKTKKQNYRGNGNLHYLPYKMNFDGYTEVDTFFESLMKDSQNKNHDYTTSFRGRVFNGKKIDAYLNYESDKDNTNNKSMDCNYKNKFGVFHAIFNKDDNGNFDLTHETNLKNFYIWKYDEDFDLYKNQNLVNIDKLVEDLGKLA